MASSSNATDVEQASSTAKDPLSAWRVVQIECGAMRAQSSSLFRKAIGFI
jgi:hypothetical protein